MEHLKVELSRLFWPISTFTGSIRYLPIRMGQRIGPMLGWYAIAMTLSSWLDTRVSGLTAGSNRSLRPGWGWSLTARRPEWLTWKKKENASIFWDLHSGLIGTFTDMIVGT